MDSGPMWGFYRISVWIMNFVYLNLLWIFFTLVGLIVFGFSPATISVFSIVRKWIQGYTDIPIFKTFWKNYRKEFLKSNALGLFLTVIGYVLYLDFQLVLRTSNTMLQYTFLPLILVILVYLLTLLYVFPIYVQYNLKMIYVLKNALVIMIFRPFTTLTMVASTVIVFALLRYVPELIPFVSVSLWAYVLMWCSNLVFKKIELQQQQQDTKTTSI